MAHRFVKLYCKHITAAAIARGCYNANQMAYHNAIITRLESRARKEAHYA